MLSKKITKFYEGACCVALLATAFSFSGCSDDDIPEANLPNPGDPVLFGVSTSSTGSRTHYEEPHGNKIPINWDKSDVIRIWSDKAYYVIKEGILNKPKNIYTADYQVSQVDADGHKYHASISPLDNSKSLLWPDTLDSNQYTFWGAYPNDRVVSFNQGSSTCSMKYITNQTCTVALDSAASTYKHCYTSQPDMKNAYMMAKNTMTANGDHVLLSFDPIMTTLKVHITAGKYEMGTGIIQPVTVTGISVVLPNYLKGGQLDYNMVENTKEGTLSKKNGLTNVTAGSTEPVFVSLNNDGKRYLDMLEGDQLELMAFLPPMDGMENAILKVHTVGGFNFQKKLTAEVVKQGYIDIKLPDITPQNASSNNWISQLPEQMPFGAMSIPGFDFKLAPNRDMAASKLEALLKKGVRVFDMSTFLDKNVNELKFGLTEQLQNFLKDNPNEFIFIVYSDLSGDEHDLRGYLDKNFKAVPPMWKNCPDLTTPIASLRGSLVVAEYWVLYDGIYSVGAPITAKRKFTHSPSDDVETLILEKHPFFQYGASGISNEYGKVANETAQTGSYGIVTIPGLANSNGFTNTDLLVQALIDCNFKFRSTKP